MSSAETQRTNLSPTPHGDATDGSPCACDPADLAPICDEQEFTDLLAGIVADYAPRVFAVVQVYGERADGRVAAWGITFDDRTEVIGVNGRRRMSLSKPENALPIYSLHEHTTARLMWVTPRPATPSDDEDS